MIKQALEKAITEAIMTKIGERDGIRYGNYEDLEKGLQEQASFAGMDPKKIRMDTPTPAMALGALINGDNAYATADIFGTGTNVGVTPVPKSWLSMLARAANKGLTADASDISVPGRFGTVPTLYHELSHASRDLDPKQIMLSNVFGTNAYRLKEETLANIDSLKNTVMQRPTSMFRKDLWDTVGESQGSYTKDFFGKNYKPAPIKKSKQPQEIAAKPQTPATKTFPPKEVGIKKD